MPKLRKLFAYGTLQIEEVMRTVSGGDYSAQPAVLYGYACYRLKDFSYPGLRREEGGKTQGLLYSGLEEEALARLDEFEDDFYLRAQEAVILDSGESVLAEVYVIPPEHYDLLVMLPWSLETFRCESLSGFLNGRPQ